MSKIVGKRLRNHFAKYMKRNYFEEITREFLLGGNMIELLVGARVSVKTMLHRQSGQGVKCRRSSRIHKSKQTLILFPQDFCSAGSVSFLGQIVYYCVLVLGLQVKDINLAFLKY